MVPALRFQIVSAQPDAVIGLITPGCLKKKRPKGSDYMNARCPRLALLDQKFPCAMNCRWRYMLFVIAGSLPRPRLLHEKSFPTYAYLPGKHPHPVRDPRGHSYRNEPVTVAVEAALEHVRRSMNRL